jgi:hypothetical protein
MGPKPKELKQAIRDFKSLAFWGGENARATRLLFCNFQIYDLPKLEHPTASANIYIFVSQFFGCYYGSFLKIGDVFLATHFPVNSRKYVFDRGF